MRACAGCQLWLTLYVTTFFDVLRDKYPDLTVGYLPYSSGRANGIAKLLRKNCSLGIAERGAEPMLLR